MPHTFILTLRCPERPGIVHAVTAFLFAHGCDIVEHRQFDDPIRHALFLRTEFVASGDADAAQLSAAFRAEVADEFEMGYQLSDDSPQRVLVMVSKMGHCLNDLIFRWRAGSLGAELVAVVSNHEDLRPMAEGPGDRRPGRGGGRVGPGREVALGAPRAAQRAQHRRLPLTRSDATTDPGRPFDNLQNSQKGQTARNARTFHRTDTCL